MLKPMVNVLLAAVTAAGGSAAPAFVAQDQETPAAAKSARGGLLVKSKHYQFEVFYFRTGVRVFVLGVDGTPLDATVLTGTATFYHPNSPQPWFTRPLKPAAGSPSPSLDVVVGLAAAPASGAKVAFEVTGLPNSEESKANFSTPLTFVDVQVERPATSESAANLPRYVYTPGYYGSGYYQYSAPGTVYVPQSAAARYYTAPRGGSGGEHYVGPQHQRDWSSGRYSPLAKPWLRPMD